MLILYINRDCDSARRERMEHELSGIHHIRIQAVDGVQWSDGIDEHGRYRWDSKARGILQNAGLLSNPYDVHYSITPTEFACGISHTKAMLYFLNTDNESCVIMEDDITLLCDSSKLSLPKGVDYFSFVGKDHPGHRLVCINDDILILRNMSAYALNRKAARAFLESTRPLTQIQDGQFSLRCFEKSRLGCSCYKNTPRVASLVAKAPDVSLVGLSEECLNTTFTSTGKKTWLDKKEDSVPYKRA